MDRSQRMFQDQTPHPTPPLSMQLRVSQDHPRWMVEGTISSVAKLILETLLLR